ncbi:Nucleoporin nup85 [Yamadazyma tenuis]|uniref:Nuclear pore complex protein Nup85 n=1 Tax=Candida tenuis (strain ATCC 10573 / BCRC 21748 / CBS 615 / JCM 9827 / NBRC 10315 / NRRL Y-1498 / VKM Y-70) TaxID=590646 RepID=G3AYL7_CANTC|nr:uncharacterized protein CANTEDRAFT_101332 [Yamadazyma tenuis ATCC 10573]EGV65884.1 hypothetical protein CANTEDRAFT_101332 [Yamadazyma tenuis ATCC 10573]WEJ95788.1 Nucleoporin nup85 [Yamadazyma tenuis]
MDTAVQDPLFSKGFDDIEMLDIGETSSDIESISKSSIPSAMGSEDSEPVVLKEWLNSDKPLNFHFNSREYKNSVEAKDEFSVLHSKYATSLYRVIESLGELDLRRTDDYDEPFGLIRSDRLAGTQDQNKKRESKITSAFLKLSDELNQFIAGLREIDSDYPLNYECLLSIIDCLHANVFYNSVNEKPNHLVRWVNRFDLKPEEELVEEIMVKTTTPYQHPLFWTKFIAKLITRGLSDQSANAIKNSGYEHLKEDDIELFQLIEDFIGLLESYNTMSLKKEFAQWKLSCCEFRDLIPKLKTNIKSPANIIVLEQIHDLAYILTGLPKTTANYCDTWYEIVTCLSLFQIRDDDSMYPQYFDIALEEKPPLLIDSEDILKSTERAFLNVFEGSYLHVLTKIDEIDSATAALVSRLFELKGLFSNYYTIDDDKDLNRLRTGKTISEYLLTKFAFQCLNTHPLAPVGIGILLNENIESSVSSINNNKTIIEEYLPKYQCKSNDDLEWCLTICAKLGLVTTASELYRIYGTKSLKDGYLYEALNMLVNCYSADGNLEANQKGMKEVHYIVWELIFQDTLLNNRPIKDELINNVVKHETDPTFEVHPVIKQCLSPYAVLFEFYNSISNPIAPDTTVIMAKSKTSRILHLLEFTHLPKKFYPLLLAQLIPFFIDDIYQFQIPELIVIIELIDNFEQQTSPDDFRKAQELYKHSITNFDRTQAESYDWRIKINLKQRSIPESVGDLTRLLRNEIVTQVGKVYVHNV